MLMGRAEWLTPELGDARSPACPSGQVTWPSYGPTCEQGGGSLERVCYAFVRSPRKSSLSGRHRANGNGSRTLPSQTDIAEDEAGDGDNPEDAMSGKCSVCGIA